MKLNATIIFDNLKESMPAEIMGSSKKDLTLERPRFFSGDSDTFPENSLFVSRADKLPSRSNIKDGVVIVCIGDSMQLTYYKDRCCIIKLEADEDIFTVFNLLQGIFDKYDLFDSKVQHILDTTASIPDIATITADLLNVSVLILNSQFEILANTEDPYSVGEDKNTLISKNLDISLLGTFLEEGDFAMSERDPLLLNILDKNLLSTNLYYKDEYAGSLTFDYINRAYRQSDTSISLYLSKIIVKALKKLSSTYLDELDYFKNSIKDLVDCMPVEISYRIKLKKMIEKKHYVCAKMKLRDQKSKIPVTYVCSELESFFSQSIAFEHNTSIVAVICVDSLIDSEAFMKKLEEKFTPFIETVRLRIGVSDVFTNLLDARMYYQQASAALSGGTFANPDLNYYNFQDYALIKLITNAVGDTSIEMYYSDGLRKLLKHDETASISYMDTLKVFLENNMSITSTASELFIHRTTLIDRIERIERELQIDLKDPSERLKLEIILKAKEIYEGINK